ncbi:hypothetical protein O181_002330 [Austropuccinia psidii MF-1]|uniref:Uncharacterized protein n=1 Tax=Austropuccinia psidii MF-1 TaxID=1389203 RepID=A0A9Q3BCU2_9BASI|nr:hypothetical protein [Austropuccinia psidii MF-1]
MRSFPRSLHQLAGLSIGLFSSTVTIPSLPESPEPLTAINNKLDFLAHIYESHEKELAALSVYSSSPNHPNADYWHNTYPSETWDEQSVNCMDWPANKERKIYAQESAYSSTETKTLSSNQHYSQLPSASDDSSQSTYAQTGLISSPSLEQFYPNLPSWHSPLSTPPTSVPVHSSFFADSSCQLSPSEATPLSHLKQVQVYAASQLGKRKRLKELARFAARVRKEDSMTHRVMVFGPTQWLDPETQRPLIKQQIMPSLSKKSPQIPCPIWPSPNALAETPDHVKCLRPFQVYNPGSRKAVYDTVSGELLDKLLKDFDLYALEYPDRGSGFKPVSQHNRIESETLPLIYDLHTTKEDSEKQFGYIKFKKWKATKKKDATKQVFTRFFLSALHFHSVSMKTFRTIPENSHTFPEWLSNVCFSPPNKESLPILGKVPALTKLDETQFGEPQKLILYYLNSGFDAALDSIGLALVSEWYKNKQALAWKENFDSTLEKFWEKMLACLMESYSAHIKFIWLTSLS